MIEEKYIQLMHQEIDGMNSAGESEELRSYISANTDAQQYYDELLEVCRRLNKVPPATPSPDLAHHIIALIPFERYAHRRFSLIEFIAQLFIGRSGVSFAAGLAIGALAIFFWIRSIQEADRLHLTGAISEHKAMIQSEPVFFRLKEVQGEAMLACSPAMVRMELHLQSENRIDATVVYEQAELQLNSFHNDASMHSLRLDDSQISISHSREGRYTILFRRLSGLPPSLQLSLRLNDRVLFEKSLE